MHMEYLAECLAVRVDGVRRRWGKLPGQLVGLGQTGLNTNYNYNYIVSTWPATRGSACNEQYCHNPQSPKPDLACSSRREPAACADVFYNSTRPRAVEGPFVPPEHSRPSKASTYERSTHHREKSCICLTQRWDAPTLASANFVANHCSRLRTDVILSVEI